MNPGIQTIVFGPAFRREETLDDALRTCRAFGFADIEIAQSPFAETLGVSSFESLERMAKRHSLRIVGYAGGSLSDRIAFLGDKLHDCYLYVDRFEACCEQLVESDARVAIHPHAFSPVQNFNDGCILRERLIELGMRPSRVGLILDTAHCALSGDEPDIYFSDEAPPLFAVHLKDWMSSHGRQAHCYAKGFCSLGEGIVKFRSVMELIEEHTPDIPVLWELDSIARSRTTFTEACALYFSVIGQIPVGGNHDLSFKFTKPPPIVRRKSYGVRETIDDCYYEILGDTISDNEAIDEATLLATHDCDGLGSCDVWSAVSTRFAPGRVIPVADSVPEIPNGSKASNMLMGQIMTWCAGRSCGFEDVQPFSSDSSGPGVLFVPVLNDYNSHHVRYILSLLYNERGCLPSPGDAWSMGVSYSERLSAAVSSLCISARQQVFSLPDPEEQFSAFFSKTIQLISHYLGAAEPVIGKLKHESRAARVHPTEESMLWPAEVSRLIEDGEGIEHQDAAIRRHSSTSFAIFLKQESLLHFAELRRSKPGLSYCDDHLAIVQAALESAQVRARRASEDRRRKEILERTSDLLTHPASSILARSRSVLSNLTESERKQFVMGHLTLARAVEDVGRAADGIRSTIFNRGIFQENMIPRERRQRVRLSQDLLAPAVRHCKQLLRIRGFDSFAIDYADCGDCPALFVDPVQMQHVFKNILDNAIKFMPPNGDFAIDIWYLDKRDSLSIFVGDSGRGVPDEFRESIFQEGNRGPTDLTGAVDGDGLGLYVSKTLMIAHGGNLTLSEEEGLGGAVFELELNNLSIARNLEDQE